MEPKPEFFITDVFGQEKYTGNQLAVFTNCSHIPEAEMQRIAREINFSETTFILSGLQPNGGFDVRIFTPDEELDFAGHPTLGTAWIIREHLIKSPVDKVVLNCRVGQIPVHFTHDDGLLWMDQPAPEFRRTLDCDAIAEVLGLTPGDFHPDFPIQEVSTGLPFKVAPLRDLNAVKRARVNRDKYFALIENAWAKGILVFCPEGRAPGQDLAVRVFVECFGIPEDPATGSGNGCLAAYLVKHRFFGAPSIDLAAGQGHEMGRPSLLRLKAREEGGVIRVSVGGEVIPVARGFWG